MAPADRVREVGIQLEIHAGGAARGFPTVERAYVKYIGPAGPRYWKPRPGEDPSVGPALVAEAPTLEH